MCQVFGPEDEDLYSDYLFARGQFSFSRSRTRCSNPGILEVDLIWVGSSAIVNSKAHTVIAVPPLELHDSTLSCGASGRLASRYPPGEMAKLVRSCPRLVTVALYLCCAFEHRISVVVADTIWIDSTNVARKMIPKTTRNAI